MESSHFPRDGTLTQDSRSQDCFGLMQLLQEQLQNTGTLSREKKELTYLTWQWIEKTNPSNFRFHTFSGMFGLVVQPNEPDILKEAARPSG